MRRKRILAEGTGYYHVITRITQKQYWLVDDEKNYLLNFIRRAAGFAGIELLTYAIMDSHVHLLVKVPVARPVDDSELIERMRILYSPQKVEFILKNWELWSSSKATAWKTEAEKAALKKRLYNLSDFCKTFKEVYCKSHNHRLNTVGTLWEARFKSIVLSSDYRTLLTVSAYINLNPVRAGICDDALSAKWTGLGAACRGDKMAISGLLSLFCDSYGLQNSDQSWSTAQDYILAAIDGDVQEYGEPTKKREFSKTFDPEEAKNALEKGLELHTFDMLRCKSRFFIDGAALGSYEFVKALAQRIGGGIYKQRSGYPIGGKLNLYTARHLRGTKISLTQYVAKES